MKRSGKMLVAVVVLLAVGAVKAMAAPYFQEASPSYLPIGAGATFSMKGQGFGSAQFGNTYGLIFHKADKNNTLVPESWQSIIPPESWVLLQVGWAGTAGNYKVLFGSSLNLAPNIQNALSHAANSAGA